MKRIYLDNNASTSLDPEVLKFLIKELEEEEGNPSSSHINGQQCRRSLETSRQTIARFFKVRPNDVIFTSGGTEGAALLIQGLMLQHPNGHMITSNAEHACVYQTVQAFEKKGYQATYLPTGSSGAVTPGDVERAIRPDTRLITIMAVNNETGVMTDLESIADIAGRYQIPFVIDGVAWLGKEEIHIPSGLTAVFFSGHKIHAPKGIGFCICPRTLQLTPLLIGGGQEQNRRGGTENLPGIVALAKAIEILEIDQTAMISQMRRMRLYFEEKLTAVLPDIVVNGSGPRVSNTSNIAFLGVDGESLLMNLDMEGISVSHGSACSSGALEPSRILLEMGIPLSQAGSSIRFSLSRFTTEGEIETTIGALIRIVNRLRKYGH